MYCHLYSITPTTMSCILLKPLILPPKFYAHYKELKFKRGIPVCSRYITGFTVDSFSPFVSVLQQIFSQNHAYITLSVKQDILV